MQLGNLGKRLIVLIQSGSISGYNMLKVCKNILIKIFRVVLSFQLAAQRKPSRVTETQDQKLRQMQWWANRRLAMFFHWVVKLYPHDTNR